MAIVRGTNCGFVSSAPSADPQSTGWNCGHYVTAQKDVAAAGETLVTEIGWWQNADGAAAVNYTVGIFSHDGDNNRPLTLLGSSSGTVSGAGWQTKTGLSISISAGSTYWIAVWVDNDALQPVGQYGSEAGSDSCTVANDTGLPDPTWLSGSADADTPVAVYAVVTEGGGATVTADAGSHIITGGNVNLRYTPAGWLRHRRV